MAGDTEALRMCSPDAFSERDANGATPMHYTAVTGNFEASLILLAASMNSLSTLDTFGLRPLDWAVLNAHPDVAHLLSAADDALASKPASDDMMTPLQLAVAMGDAEMVAALLEGGVSTAHGCNNGPLTPVELARTLGHNDCAEVLETLASATPAPPSPQLASPSPPPPAQYRRTSATALAADRTAWDAALRDSVPLLIEGLGEEWSAGVGQWSLDELRQRWGDHSVSVTYSPDEHYQRVARVHSDGPWQLLQPPSTTMPFASFVDTLRAAEEDGGRRREHLAVQQSRTASLDELDGFGGRKFPPLVEQMLAGMGKSTGEEQGHSDVDGDCAGNANGEGSGLPDDLHANLWVCVPPKVSRLHYDSDDSLLVQLRGSKRFTLIDPTPLGGLTPYPTRLLRQRLARRAPGEYELAQPDDDPTVLRNFPLVGLAEDGTRETRFDTLFRHARVTTIDVPAGSALLLPAYWYHEVESHTPEGEAAGEANLAVNYWWGDKAVGNAMRHGVLRDRLHAVA